MRTYMTLLDDLTEEPLWSGEVPEPPVFGDTMAYTATDEPRGAGVVRIVRRHWAVGPGPYGPGWAHITVRAVPYDIETGRDVGAEPVPVDGQVLDGIVQMAILGTHTGLITPPPSRVPGPDGQPQPETRAEHDRRIIRAVIDYTLRNGLLVVGDAERMDGRWFPIDEPGPG